ncbi:hydroxyethylthiazole kinase [Bacteroides nordii]|uniref:hydroxyethylthiazole kinase n=1 Tax=Bacteroides nordii TaxID=291645 RepID=UPI00241E73AF|nr:hydroxyethylthiazole kinase [Bacteroides nordii]MBD9111533.1 hydroxyethylthiazole kinase [Bacteroides nordii]
MLKSCLENVRLKTPLIHNITNYVTVNDVANILLACGGSPIMADDDEEAEEITSICAGLNINIGTLNSRTIPSMHKAGKTANRLGHPIVLDPVGAGASKLRTKTAENLLSSIKFDVIRGNISEIKALALGSGGAKGVDADISDKVTDENLSLAIAFAEKFSAETGAVISISGATDIVCGGTKAYVIKNGHPMMSQITGSGCMLTAMTAAYIAANNNNILEAAAAATIAMGVCGELAYERLSNAGGGNASFRNYLIDAVYNLDGDTLERRAKYEIY